MTVQEAQALMSRPYPAEPAAHARSLHDSKDELERGEYYLLRVEDEGVDLTFNWYKKLIKAENPPPPRK